MTPQFIEQDMSVPAGTPETAPVQVTVPMQSGWISDCEVMIPAGHCLLTGFAVTVAGTLVVPYSGSAWVVDNDTTIKYPINRWVNQGNLVIQGFNTGIFPHKFFFRATWHVSEPMPQITTAVSGITTAEADTTAAVAGLAAEPDETDTDLTGLDTTDTSSADGSDLTGLDQAPVIDVTTLPPPPPIGSPPPTAPVAPVSRANVPGAGKPPAKKPGPVRGPGKTAPKPEPKKPAKPTGAQHGGPVHVKEPAKPPKKATR
jgi:hypothetical protein